MDVERRQTARVSCMVPVQVYPDGAVQAIETLTKDLSSCGLCVFSPIALPPTCHVTIHAVFGIGQPPVTFCARTAWFRSTPSENQFRIGLHIDHPSSLDNIRLSTYITKLSRQAVA